MEGKREYDEHFKIILLGDNRVGKSCLMDTYGGRTLYISDEYMDTMGVDQRIKLTPAFNKKIQLRIWDASGNPRLYKIVESYFKSVDGALICFDLTNKTTLWHTKEHIQGLRAIKPNIPLILVGCKADSEQRREISFEQAKELADELGLTYLETSALRRVNIDQPFLQITSQIYLSKQLNKIKPMLEEYFNNYLQLTNPKNRSSLFAEQIPGIDKEGRLREEYRVLFEKLFHSKRVEDVGEFCRKTLDLIEKADNLYKQDSPVLSTFTTSPLSRTLKQILNGLSGVLVDMMSLSAVEELLQPKKSIAAIL